MAKDRCPRCHKWVEHGGVRCPYCDLYLRHEENAPDDSGEGKGRSFAGLPSFLRKEEPDWAPPEVALHRPLWPAWLSCLIAGLLLWAYRAPLLQMGHRLMGTTEDGEISIKVSSDSAVAPPPPAQNAAGPAMSSASNNGIGSTTAGTSPAESAPLVASAQHWIFSGTVYDLITMKPVPRAALVFEDAGLSRYFKTSSKKNGNFKIELPEASTEGYYLKVRRRGYAARALVEDGSGALHLRSLSAAKRRKLGADFTRTISRPKPIAPTDGAEPLKLFLVPVNPS